MKRIVAVAALCIQLAPGARARETARAGQSLPLDLNGYTSELERWSSTVGHLREHPRQAAVVRKQLPDHWSVVVHGEQFVVSTEWLDTALGSLETNPAHAASVSSDIQARLDMMRKDSEALAKVPAVNSSVARTKLDNILKRREFRGIRAENPLQSIWERFIEWLAAFFSKLFGRLRGHPAASNVLLWTIVAALGLILLVWLVRAVSGRSPHPLPLPAVAGTPPENWQDRIQQARRAAALGDCRDAIRLVYSAALWRLGELGVWQVDPSRTHREYLRLLDQASARRRPVAAIITRFERVWYANEHASASDFESVLAELEMLR